MVAQKETERDLPIKTRVRIITLTNRSERVRAIRRALSHKQNKDLLTEEVSDMIMEAGCKMFEQQLGIGNAA